MHDSTTYPGHVARLLLLALVLGGGCGWVAGLDDPISGNGGDGDVGDFCYGTGLVRVCFSAEPTGDQMVSSTISTGDFSCSANVISGGTGLCVLSGSSITIPPGSSVLATNASGTTAIPLVLVATDSITISGTLDAAGGHSSSSTPAGSGFSGCQSGTNPGSGGGGQGGSFLAAGGNGGAGSGSGGAAGMELPIPTMVHGGCPGARGGGGSGGNGAKGGGAVYLIAVNTITIDGRVDASGGGGGGTDDNGGAGGGGGGSGGMIALDAPTLSITGAVCAVGGSGAAGSATSSSSASGMSGGGGTTACTIGTPGVGQSTAGSGGAGATNGVGTAGAAGTNGAGGGGGGGSSGYIKIFGGSPGSATIVPPAA
jgi:hypothetical protein